MHPNDILISPAGEILLLLDYSLAIASTMCMCATLYNYPLRFSALFFSLLDEKERERVSL